jgi:hypothetical protein
MRRIFALAALILSAATAYAAEPAGRYRIEGTNPGNQSRYAGAVQVERTGQTYRVVWIVGKSRYVGTGIGSKEFLAVTYGTGAGNGVALYAADGGNWKGLWSNLGGRALGSEIWTRE